MTFLDPLIEAGEGIASDLIGLGEEIVDQIKDRGEARIPVESSAIAELHYRLDRTLSIVFNDGRRYAIENFPAIELRRWLDADSIGAYWNANLRGKY
jgi:KTSC domain